ncbi:(d)CMP kinase [Thermocrinis sp.]
MKIAIDGPSASGKSTIAKLLSQKLGIPYLETGLLYRMFGYIAFKEKIKPEEALELFEQDFKVIYDVGKTEVYWKGKKLSEELKKEEVGKYASLLGEIPAFRKKMIEFFRRLVGDTQLVAEGRDVGTHIFPEAPLKFFITASPEERAKRRYLELRLKGFETSYEEVLNAIQERDLRDANRPVYPFKPAKDAHIIDTTNRTVEEVLEFILNIIKGREIGY